MSKCIGKQSFYCMQSKKCLLISFLLSESMSKEIKASFKWTPQLSLSLTTGTSSRSTRIFWYSWWSAALFWAPFLLLCACIGVRWTTNQGTYELGEYFPKTSQTLLYGECRTINRNGLSSYETATAAKTIPFRCTFSVSCLEKCTSFSEDFRRTCENMVAWWSCGNTRSRKVVN